MVRRPSLGVRSPEEEEQKEEEEKEEGKEEEEQSVDEREWAGTKSTQLQTDSEPTEFMLPVIKTSYALTKQIFNQ